LRWKRLLATLCVLAVLPGCFSRHSQIAMSPDPSLDRESRITTWFDYPREPVEASNHNLDVNDTYQVKMLTIASHGKEAGFGDTVGARYYMSRREGPRRLVIVLPIWAASAYPSNKMAKTIRARSDGDTNVLVVLGKQRLIDWTTMARAEDEEAFSMASQRSVEHLTTRIIDVRRFIDWAEGQPEIDPDRIALVGFSLSGIVAAVITGIDPRISASALVMAGGDLGAMFGSCSGKAGKVRDSIRARFGWTQKEYEAKITEDWDVVDPVHYAGNVDPRSVLIIEAAHDHCLPERSREALVEAMGRPQRITLKYGHQNSFLAMTPLAGNYLCDAIYEFLDRTL